MQLLPCIRPPGPLESAPHTSLRADSEIETWEGYWSVADGGYYTRCARADGSEQWYRVVDEAPRDESESAVFALPSRAPRQFEPARMRLLSTQGHRAVLVGTSRRTRARPAGVGNVR